MASIQVYYEFADGTPWVAKALPEDWRRKGEGDAAFAQRCGLDVFQAADDGEGEFRAGNWSVMKEAPEIAADPVRPALTKAQLLAQVAALQTQIATLAQTIEAAPEDAVPVEEALKP